MSLAARRAFESGAVLTVIRSLRFRVLFSLFLSIALVALASAFLLYQSERKRLSAESERAVGAFADLFQNHIDVRSSDLEMALETLFNDPSILDLFESRDRAALLSRVRPLFDDTLKPKRGVTQFHFHTPPAISFLRVHRPEEFGDDLSGWRTTIVRANRDRETVSGLEVSRSGPGLKVVLPVDRRGVTVGTVELASQVTTVLEALSASLDVNYAVGVKEGVWERARCDDLLTREFALDDTIYYRASSPWISEAMALWKDPEPGKPLDFAGRRYAASTFEIADTTGEVVGSVLVVSDVTASFGRFRSELGRTLGLILLLGLGVGSLVFIQLNRSILSPLQGSVTLARSIEEGELSARTQVAGVQEVADLGSSLNRMAKKLQGAMKELQHRSAEAERSRGEAQRAQETAERQKESLATGTARLLEGMERFRRGDLTVRVEAGDIGELEQLFSGFNHSIQQLRAMVQQVSEVASSAAGATAEVSAQAEQMATSAADHRMRSIEVSRGMTSVTKSTAETARLASEAATRSQVAGEAARKGVESVDATRLGMQGIVDSTKVTVEKIGAVVGSIDRVRDIAAVIGGIAKQTNLLALNAAVQAAHAGKYGQGFAVIADEIKKLAEETAASTKSIATTVDQIRSAAAEAAESVSNAKRVVERGRSSVEGVSGAFTEIDSSSVATLDLADRVASASADQAAGSEVVATHLEAMMAGNEQLAIATAQIATAAEDLSGLTHDLEQSMARFAIEDGPL